MFTIAAGTLAAATSSVQERADRLLALANTGCQALYRASSGAQRKAVTDVTPEHDAAAEATGKAYAAFHWQSCDHQEARDLLTHRDELNELTVRQIRSAPPQVGRNGPGRRLPSAIRSLTAQ